MNLLDKMIAVVAPIAATRRAAARAALAEFDLLDGRRSYESAKLGRRTAGWTTAGTSANAEIGPAQVRLRNRSRDLVRNNPHGNRAVNVIVANVVGVGMKPRLSAAGQGAAPQALETFQEWMTESDLEGQLNWCAQQKLVMRSVAESGEALILWEVMSGSSGLRVPIQCSVLEPDYLDAGKSGAVAGGGQIFHGVEVDSFGRRVAYWLFPEHPGETITTIKRRFESRRVPAKNVDHVFDTLRPGQVRGVPMFAAVALRLRDIDDYNDAEIVRKKIEACFAAFVTRAGGSANSPLGATTTDADSRRIEALAPGLVQYLAMDEDVKFSAPESSGDYAEFLSVQLHAVAAGLGITYEDLTGDLSKVNFTSMRMGKLGFYALVDQIQQLMFIPLVCDRAWSRVGRMVSFMEGSSEPWPAAEWGLPGRPYIDPREVRARIDEIRAGLTTLRREIAAKGLDPDKVLQEIAETGATLDELGITLDSDPRRSGRTGAPGNAGAGEGLAEEKDEEGKDDDADEDEQ
jgi:lambda family phage portal protein